MPTTSSKVGYPPVQELLGRQPVSEGRVQGCGETIVGLGSGKVNDRASRTCQRQFADSSSIEQRH